MPAAKWVSWEPVSRDNTRAGAVLAFGEPVEPQYRFDQADVILSLEADFVSGHPSSLRLVREFAARRKAGSDLATMNRLYVVEGSPTLSGASADHRLALRSSAIEGFARAVAAGCGLAVEGAVAHEWVGPIVTDLKRAGSKALVLAGESQPAAVHALAHAINEALGAVGTTVSYTAPAEAQPGGETAALKALVEEMQRGEVEMLVVLGANPVYAAPADLKVVEALDKVPFRVHHGMAVDESAGRVHWHLPASHPLESWGDLRAADGTATIVQPLIAPLYHTLSEIEVLDAFARAEGTPKGYDIVRAHWRTALGEADFDTRWNRALHDGVVLGTRLSREGREDPRGLDPGARGRRGGRPRGRVPSRPGRLRRTLREPRLAAGAAEAAHQGHLGQPGARQPEDGGRARRRQDRADRARAHHGGRRADARRPHGEGAALGPARPRRRCRDAAPRVRPHARRPARQRHGLRRLRAPHERRSVDGVRPPDPQDRRDRAHRLHPGSLDDRSARAPPGPGAPPGASRDEGRAREGRARGPEDGARARAAASRSTRPSSTRATPGA